jgi:hypothetical protein
MGRLLFLLSVVICSSMAAWSFARSQSPLDRRSLRAAIGVVFECLGTFSVFLAVNTVLAAGLILLVRGLTNYFVSLYLVTDSTLIVLSIVQGFVFQLWWREQ